MHAATRTRNRFIFEDRASTAIVHALSARLARFPIRWTHLIDKKSRQLNMLSMFLSQKRKRLLRNTLARFPIRWTHLIDKKSRQLNMLSMFLSQKRKRLLRNMP